MISSNLRSSFIGEDAVDDALREVADGLIEDVVDGRIGDVVEEEEEV